MVRARVNPWIATATATVFVFFGAGWADIIWAFQIGFTAALVFGLVHLMLADHDGPVDARDWLGLLSGAIALTCSGVAVTMVAVVGLTTALRRSVRVALLHTAPLAAIYLMWEKAFPERHFRTPTPDASEAMRWFWAGAAAALVAIARSPLLAWALLGAVACGLVLTALREHTWARIRVVLAAPLSLLGGAFLFIAFTAVRRAGLYPSDHARASRYVYVVAALALPAIALAMDALIRRWRVLIPPLIALIVISLVGNIGAFADQRRLDARTQPQYRNLMLTIAHDPLARRTPPSLTPERVFAITVTVGWLLSGARAGRIPRPAMTESELLDARLYLSLAQLRFPIPKSAVCSPFSRATTVRLAVGDAFVLGYSGGLLGDGGALASLLDTAGRVSTPRLLAPPKGAWFVAIAGPLTLRVTPRRAGQWCGVVRAHQPPSAGPMRTSPPPG
jgi:hypothetical protein